MIKKQKWAFQSAGLCGFAYLLLYLFDLLKIFPTSSDAMSSLLLTVEIIGTFLGIFLIGFSYKLMHSTDKTQWNSSYTISKTAKVVGVILIILGAFVLYFATASVLKL